MRNSVERIRKQLFQDYELRARQLYELLLEQPLEVREYLQGYINNWPLTKGLPKKFSVELNDDSGD